MVTELGTVAVMLVEPTVTLVSDTPARVIVAVPEVGKPDPVMVIVLPGMTGIGETVTPVPLPEPTVTGIVMGVVRPLLEMTSD